MKKTLKNKKKAVVKKKTVRKITAKRKPVKKTPARRTKTPGRAVKRPAGKKPAGRTSGARRAGKAAAKTEKGFLGEITHYFPKVRAAVIKLNAELSVGDKIKIKGHTTDFTQKVSSLQIDRIAINSARKGDEIGLMVESRVRRGDKVTKL